MIRICIYDSDMLMLSEMESLLLKLGSEEKIFVDIDVFNTKSEFLSHLSGDVFDLIYVSIDKDYEDTVCLANKAKQYNQHIIIIYVAENESLWKVLLEANMFRLITKPIEPGFFRKCFIDACESLDNRKNYFEYKYRGKICRVIFNDILFFESSGRYVIIHTKEESTRMIGTLSTIECQLQYAKAAFLRIHQSYLVNEMYIKNIKRTSLCLFNGTQLPISKRRYPCLREVLLKPKIS